MNRAKETMAHRLRLKRWLTPGAVRPRAAKGRTTGGMKTTKTKPTARRPRVNVKDMVRRWPTPRTPRHPNSKAAGRRAVLLAQANEDLLVAANVALAELARLDGMEAHGAGRIRPGAYLGLRNALWHLDALDG